MTTAVFEGDAFDGRTGGGAITLELLEVGPGKGAGAPPVRGVFLAPPEHTRRPDGSDEVQCRGAARREAAPEKTRFDLARALFAVAIAGSWPEPWVENLIGDRLLAFDDVVETDGDVIVEFTFRLVIPTSVPLPVLVHVTAFDLVSRVLRVEES